jgi:hypothetical protein
MMQSGQNRKLGTKVCLGLLLSALDKPLQHWKVLHHPWKKLGPSNRVVQVGV